MELNERIMIFIVMASEMFKKRSSAVLRQYGLTFSHYNVLRHLVACEQGRDTIGNVGKKLLVTPSCMTGLARRIENAALIDRKDAKDERLTILQITSQGLKILDTIREIQEQHGGSYLETCSQEQKEEVLAVLKHIVRTGKRLVKSQSE